jgi:hypothetical protein
MSNNPSRPQWGELEQICSFPVLMKFWQQRAAYIVPGEQGVDAPVFLDGGGEEDDSVKAAATIHQAETPVSPVGTIGEASSVLSGSASTGNSEYPSR